MPTTKKEVRKRNSAAHYQRNRAAIIASSLAYKNETRRLIRTYVIEYLEAHPCVDCGETDPMVLEFDHRDRAAKSFTVFARGSTYSFNTVKSEIAKCDVRCANCHRRKTSKESRTWRYRWLCETAPR